MEDKIEITEEQRQILLCMAEGLTDMEIGRKLFISEGRTRAHGEILRGKLKARNRAHAVAIGFREHLIT